MSTRSPAPQMTTPTRIAFCITDLDPGGAERCLVRIATGLDRSQWEPTVACLSAPGELASQLQQVGIPVFCLGGRRRPLRAVRRLAAYWKESKPAILQTFLFHANLAGRIAARRARIPVVVSGIRVADHRYRTRLWLDRFTNGLVTANVCVSEAVARFSTEAGRLKASKVTVIPNGVEVDHFASAAPLSLDKWGVPRNSQVILGIGRLDPQKGWLDLFRACKPLLEHDPRLHILIAGSGPQEPELRRWIDDAEFDEQIHLVGWQGDIPGLLKSATVAVLPSHWEGMPNALLEALASGCPIVATRVEGSTEVLEPLVPDWLVPPQSPRELRTAIERVLMEPIRAQRAAYKSQTVLREQFTWDAVIGRYEELYRQLMLRAGIR